MSANRIVKHKVKIPIFQCNLTIICADNIEEVAKNYNVEGIKKGYCDAYVFRRSCSDYFYVQEPSVSFGSIAHEAKHIVNYIFSDAGIELDKHNDEAECYLLGWIVDIIHKKINEGPIK